jgi:hypothetical protein
MGWTTLQDGWIVNTKGNLRRQSIRQAACRETDGEVDKRGDWRCQGLLGNAGRQRVALNGKILDRKVVKARTRILLTFWRLTTYI